MMGDLSRVGICVNSEVESGVAPKTESIFRVQPNGNPARCRMRQPGRLRSPEKHDIRLKSQEFEDEDEKENEPHPRL
jgi:hypothetical protein